MSRRARVALVAAGVARRRPRAAGGRGPRPRPAHEPADPRVAVRLGGHARAGRVVRGPGRVVAGAAAAGPAVAGAAGRARARCSGRRATRIVCGLAGARAARVVVAAGYVGRRLRARQPGADLHPDRLLGRAGFASVLFGDVFRAFSPWRVLRFRGCGPIPSAGAATPPRSPSSASPGSSSSRAGASPRRRWRALRGLHALHARRPARVRDRDVEPPRRGLRRLLQPDLARLDLGAARSRARRAAAAGRPAAAGRQPPGPSSSSAR